jgi:hypothetical protein
LWVWVLAWVLAEDILRPLARIDAEDKDRARDVLGVALDVDGRVAVVGIVSIRMGEGGLVEVVDKEIFS